MAAKSARRPGYENSVFVNCPFDEQYKPLFRALVFAIEYCGFAARCALEVDDSGETRAAKILRLIRDSRYGVHDISRTELNDHGLPRFNMPNEFGLFVGFRSGGDRRQQRKVVLVLDRERYRYQQYISDIAGQDIRSHADRSDLLIREVRDWLQYHTARELDGGERIAEKFALFGSQLPQLLAAMNKTERGLDNYVDFQRLVYAWIKVNVELAE